MEKLILVVYIYVGNINESELEKFMDRVVQSLRDETRDIIVIPVRNGETRVECINPKIISEDEYGRVLEIVNEAKDKIEEFIKK